MNRLDRWTVEASHALACATGTDEASISHDVNTGAAALLKFDGGRAWCVLRLDRFADHTELVGVAFEGIGLRRYVPYILAAGRKLGAACVRFHSKHAAMGRLVGHGARHREHVFEVVL